MAWQFIESMILGSQWKETDWITGNLFKIVHICSFPLSYAWKYTGLIGQILNDTEYGNLKLYGDIQQLYFDPPNQYIWFNPLDNIDLRKIAVKGYWSDKTTFSWIVQIYAWDQLISQNATTNGVDLTELTTLNNQQIALLNDQLNLLNTLNLKSDQIITDINSLAIAGGGGASGTTPNGNGGGNPNLNF